MLESFSFYRTPLIHFGADCIDKLPESLPQDTNNVLLVTGKKSYSDSPFRERIESLFSKQDITAERVAVSTEPKDQFIDEICGKYRKRDIDAVVAIGGGSVLDTGKAISAMLTVEGSIREYIEGIATRSHPGTKKPFIAIPTTSGTGSEASANSVITVSGTPEMKRSIRHTSFVPDVAIVDPQLTASCPEGITAACGMDTLTQLIESYVSTSASPVTDSLAEKALSIIEPALFQAVRNGTDINARSAMAYASLISGITLANTGLGTVHGIAPVVGAGYSVPHGVACGLLLGPVTEATIGNLKRSNEHHHPVLRKYARIAELLLHTTVEDPAEGSGMLIDYIEKLTAELKLPSFSEYNVREADIEEMSQICRNKKNPVPLSNEQIRSVLMKKL
ncbi:MAG: iron-containing alcohol dehydrogenase [Chitinispirillaceae bacterium]